MSVVEFLQLLVILFWWLPIGFTIKGLQILQDRRRKKTMSNEETTCPKCGHTEGFDISSADGCEGEVHELHCWNCDCYFNPNTGEIKNND